jgi:hypothetical protein
MKISFMCEIPNHFDPITKSEGKLGLAGAVSILALLSFCATLLRPSTLLANEQGQSEGQRSVILPPPNEAQPPPPPTENLVEYGDNSPDPSGRVTLCNATAEPRCGNILELPRSVFFPRHRLLALYRKHKAIRGLEEGYGNFVKILTTMPTGIRKQINRPLAPTLT